LLPKKTNKKLKMVEISKNELQMELSALRLIIESPNSYLSNYFSDLRNKVDQKMISKKMKTKKHEIQRNLNEIEQKIMEKINSFESDCINKGLTNQYTVGRLFSIESELRNESTNNFHQIKQAILNEETIILKELFQNKTISFVEFNQDKIASDENEDVLFDCKLVILNDEFINNRLVRQRYNF